MIEQTSFTLQASNVYFGLSLMVHSVAFLSVWLYGVNVYINLALSLVLLVHFQYLKNHILLKKPHSIRTFLLDEGGLTTIDNSNVQRRYANSDTLHHSRFLVVIQLDKCALVVFKDSVASHSLSQLNRLLTNART